MSSGPSSATLPSTLWGKIDQLPTEDDLTGRAANLKEKASLGYFELDAVVKEEPLFCAESPRCITSREVVAQADGASTS